MQTYNVYCDESCHLENDRQTAMVLGAVWCPLEKTREISTRLREIKVKHGFHPQFEMKWVKVSPKKVDYYLEVVNYFFDEPALRFRALIVPDKSILRPQDFDLTHDDFYYRMYYYMLRIIFDVEDHYNVYIDIKDSWGSKKIEKLWEVLSNKLHDQPREIITNMQIIRSDDSDIMQLADLLIGAVGYLNRGLDTSEAKLAVIDLMKRRSGYPLTHNTRYLAEKINILRWRPSNSVVNNGR